MKATSLLATIGCLLLSAPDALAFCRATTCDPTDVSQRCTKDPKTECLTKGAPLFWASDCVTVNVQIDAAPKAGIDYQTAEASVKRAFAAWTEVDCNGSAPSIRVDVAGPVSCASSEYSGEHRNANIVMFREDTWPYEGAEDALGITRVRFDLEDVPGTLWDADIEVNAIAEPLTTGSPKADEVDLDSVLTHEAGHLLGLAHTLDVEATMAVGYQRGSQALRSLEADDVAGICALYSPGREVSSSSCEPRHGFSGECAADQTSSPTPVEPGGAPSESDGCSLVASAPVSRRGSSFWVIALVVGGVAWRRSHRLSRRKRLVAVPLV